MNTYSQHISPFIIFYVIFLCQGATSGPLSVLYECMNNGIKAKIWVRRYKGLRGCLTGYIAAFDNHMNLVSEPQNLDYFIFLLVVLFEACQDLSFDRRHLL